MEFDGRTHSSSQADKDPSPGPADAPASTLMDLDGLFDDPPSSRDSAESRAGGRFQASTFARLFSAFPLPVFLIDRSTAILFANEAAESIPGAETEITGLKFDSFTVSPQSAEELGSAIEHVLDTGDARTFEDALRVGRARLWARVRVRGVRIGGEPLALAVMEDVSEEKRQSILNHRHEGELQRIHYELEKRVSERTVQLREANERLTKEIAERSRVETELRNAREQLEERVKRRTEELTLLNEHLKREFEQRRRADEALAKSEEKFRTIFRDSLDVILIIDSATGTILGANNALQRILGYEPDGVIGRHFSVLYPPEPEDGEAPEEDSVRVHGAVFEAHEIIDSEGEAVPMDLTATVIPWEDGTALLATFRDIRDREQALRALQESEERYRTLFEQAGDAIFLEDAAGSIRDANGAAVSLFGFDHEELKRMRATDLWPCTTVGAEKTEERDRSIERPTETLGRRKKGDAVPIEIARAAFRSGEETYFLSIVRDISDRKKAEEALRQAHELLEQRVYDRTRELVETNERLEREIVQRMEAERTITASLREKEVLLHEIHHRVKNNLQVISSMLTLQSGRVRDEHTAAALEDSRNRVRSMALIHEQLYRSRDLARIDFADFLKDLTAALLSSYAENRAAVSFRIKAEQVSLDIQQAVPCALVVNELISNALKHAFAQGSGGVITVEFGRHGDREFRLVVADNGRGLPEGLDYRSSRSLGLRLVVKLAEIQLHGKLEVGSDCGTKVSVIFPRRDSAAAEREHAG